MGILQEVKAKLDEICGIPPKLIGSHLSRLAPLIDRKGTLSILDQVLQDEQLLGEIAARSYTHTLGFRKLVLLDPGFALPDGSFGYGYQLRLHVWDASGQCGVPLVESMHEHSFDFISHMLMGEMENQCYKIEPVDLEDPLVTRVLARRARLSDTDAVLANQQLEALESLRLSGVGSLQSAVENSSAQVDIAKLSDLLGLPVEDVEKSVALQGRYQAVSSAVSGGGYVHRLVQMVRLVPHVVLSLKAGDTYYHPHQFAHRLYIRAGQSNATMIVTTPVSQEAKGGSFQRPTRVAGSEVNYARQLYTADHLAVMLQRFRDQLRATTTKGGNRLLSVA